MEYNKFLTYVVNELKYMPQEINRTIEYINKFKCSLSLASIDIKRAIDDAIRDYCIDNDIYYYQFDVEEYFGVTIDDIFFNAVNKLNNNF